MTDVRIEGDTLVIEPMGWHKLLSLKNTIRVPLSHVTSFRAEPETRLTGWVGWRVPGTYLPGVIIAGSYYNQGWTFWDVRNPRNTIVIELSSEKYKKIIVDVSDPDTVLKALAAR